MTTAHPRRCVFDRVAVQVRAMVSRYRAGRRRAKRVTAADDRARRDEGERIVAPKEGGAASGAR